MNASSPTRTSTPSATTPPSTPHGGPDALGVPRHDFSTNANAAGPFPHVMAALGAADRRRYPDPHYTALRERLAPRWAAAPARLLPTAGTSEAIRRLTLAASLAGVRTVHVPCPAYGDYAAAATALGLAVRPWRGADELLEQLRDATAPALAWVCEPASPGGSSLPCGTWSALSEAIDRRGHLLALDRAYEPLRLDGEDPVPRSLADRAWSCWSPNKALATPGVRAGLLVMPADLGDDAVRRTSLGLEALAPSWVLSAEGVVLLEQWHAPATAAALAASRDTLRAWRAAQRGLLSARGWEQAPTVTPFWVARPRLLPGTAGSSEPAWTGWLDGLRARGVKLRDTRSMGLPGWVRLSAQPPSAQQALAEALEAALAGRPSDSSGG